METIQWHDAARKDKRPLREYQVYMPGGYRFAVMCRSGCEARAAVKRYLGGPFRRSLLTGSIVTPSRNDADQKKRERLAEQRKRASAND